GGLVVVPHRQLHQVPFHALYDGRRHLAERWATTVAPTLAGRRRTAVRTRGAAPGPDRGVLVLAVPDAHAPPGAAGAQAIAGLLPGARVMVGDVATRDALATAAPRSGIVHIACHGLYRPGNPMFSALRLADGWMSSAEVLELDLDGALVTLSACESGRHARGTAEPVAL